jgi:RNA polymerase primary sigma factor
VKGKVASLPFAWKLPPPNHEEEARAQVMLGKNYELFWVLRHGNENERKVAEVQLLKRNEALVNFVICRFLKGLPRGDLLNGGRQGLLKAIRHYDYSLGVKFSSYAFDWIRQALRRMYDNESSTVRIPSHMVQSISELARAAEKHERRFGVEPSDRQLAKILSWKISKVKAVREAAKIQMISFDSKVIGTENLSMAEKVSALVHSNAAVSQDFMQPSPEEEFENRRYEEMQRQRVDALLSDNRLSDLERFVLAARFGINMPEMTLEEVGERLGCTKEWIRQIQKRATLKLSGRSAPRKFIPRAPKLRMPIVLPAVPYKRKREVETPLSA